MTPFTLVRRSATSGFVLCFPLLFYIHNTDMSYTKNVFGLVALSALWGLWALRGALQGRVTLHRPPLLGPGLALLGAGALSLLGASSPAIGLQSLGLLLYALLSYVWLYHLARAPHARALLLGAALLSALTLAGYGVLQHQALLPSSDEGVRLIASLGNRVAVGQFLNGLTLAALAGLLWARGRLGRALAGLAAFAAFAALLLTETAGPLLSFSVALGAVIALTWGLRRRLEGVSVRAWLAGLLAVWAVASASIADRHLIHLIVPRSPTPVGVAAQRAQLLDLSPLVGWLEEMWRANSGDLRAYYWWVGLEMWRSSPWWGVGLGHYKVQYADHSARLLATPEGKATYDGLLASYANAPTLRPAQAHNDYVQLVAETGLIGLLALLYALWALARTAWRQLRRARGPTLLGGLLLHAGAGVFLLDAAFNFPAHLPASAFNFTLQLALAHAGGATRSTPRALNGFPARAVGALVLAGTLSVGVLAARDWQANLDLERGQAALRQGRVAEAEAAFERSLALDFAPSAVLYHLGTLALSQGEAQRARALLERSLATGVYEDTLWRLANLTFQLEDVAAARGHLDRLLAALPDPSLFLEARYLDALVELRLGRVDEAVTRAEATLAAHPEFEQMVLVLADAALVRRDYAAAQRHYRRALGYVEGQLANVRAFLAENGPVPEAQADLATLERQRQQSVSILDQWGGVL